MHLFKNLILTLCLFSFSAKGQITQYKSLLDTAIKFTGQLFVSSKPITKIGLDEKEVWNYLNYFKEFEKNGNLDTIMLLQIINNSKSIDTTSWADSELDKVILIQNRTQHVQLKYAIQKFNLTDKKQIKYYRKQINQLNSADGYNKNIYSYSRPVFDNSKQFAIIQYDNAHSGLGGGGGIKLYQLTGGTWKELGNVMMWKY